ncbi:energy-coupling factor ABC transporter permease [Azospirillum rugosum]|uniref:ABC-type Co2+ transport system permease subunit n=1 Tax=Azospirillum rugosum TaxID=416170 RepID=A0ABS4SSE3_9PROT|nr:energy-coupling factor ABC transporter permease [Azospirillum rugosum]MBP2295479.1 ABC-type Co2+ transport system permease subunit [Azospirillum rugosum]MDQ0528358.1 ABC-type Co2+ transport system permease subunit [Azospirillum rugosum]
MHIEPGMLSAAKIMGANAAVFGVLSSHAPSFLRRPTEWVKSLLAAAFFSVLMEVWHQPVGPSELHFIGASAVYFIFGFRPTMFGFAIGLLFQGLLFEPQDLVHLSVNALSLIVPLVGAHLTVGRGLLEAGKLDQLRWSSVLRFDAVYYSGVVAMVGFWLMLGEEATPLADWAVFAASYLPVVLCEPALSCGLLRALGRLKTDNPILRYTTLAGPVAV